MSELSETVLANDPENEQFDKFLSFELGGKAYAITISVVREIMEYIDVDHIPMSPDFILGAINLRGLVIPVLDLSIRLGGQTQQVTNRTCIVIVEVHRENQTLTIGLKVDLVTRVIDICLTDVDSVPSIGGQFESRFVLGLAKLSQGLLVLLDVNKLLTLNELDHFSQNNIEQTESSFATLDTAIDSPDALITPPNKEDFDGTA